MCSSRLVALFLSLPALLAAPLHADAGLQSNDVVPLVPQPRTVFHVDFNENGTAQQEEAPFFEVIPVEYLCDFCFAVIEMLKNMQKADKNFEGTMRKDCLNHTVDESKKEICGYVNKINLDRLRNESPSKICLEERLCLSTSSPNSKEVKAPVEQSVDEKPQATAQQVKSGSHPGRGRGSSTKPSS